MAESDRRKWDAIYRDGRHGDPDPPAWLDELTDEIPRTGTALDVASGAGAVSIWLAQRGLGVTAVDISPVGLDLLKRRAADRELSVTTRVMDLEVDPLPEGVFDVVACFHYLQRDLFPSMHDRLARSGLLIVEHPTLKNLERHEKPGRHHLLEPQEILTLIGNLRVLAYHEGWIDDRHLARIVARRS